MFIGGKKRYDTTWNCSVGGSYFQRVIITLHVCVVTRSASLLSLLRVPQISCNLPAVAGFLCDEAIVLGWTVKDPVCTQPGNLTVWYYVQHWVPSWTWPCTSFNQPTTTHFPKTKFNHWCFLIRRSGDVEGQWQHSPSFTPSPPRT